MTASDKIEIGVNIPADVHAVYEALTNPKIHAVFTKTKVTGDPIIGGMYQAGDNYISGKYLELVPDWKIVIEWKTRDWPDDTEPSIITFILNDNDDNTLLQMVQTKTPLEQVEMYKKGWWDHYWNPMIAYFQEREQQGSQNSCHCNCN